MDDLAGWCVQHDIPTTARATAEHPGLYADVGNHGLHDDTAAEVYFVAGNALAFLGFDDPTNQNNRRLHHRATPA